MDLYNGFQEKCLFSPKIMIIALTPGNDNLNPQVLKRTELPAAATPTPVETYSINGVNYTTYTTFRSPMTPEDAPPGIEDPDRDADPEDLTPTAERLLGGPVIPEPDYDQSDQVSIT
jgi:hypothetical protein